jgi:hypothetical protein
MEKRTEGAWIIHHTKKILNVVNAQEFEEIELAGKCGMFLSNLAATNSSVLSDDKIAAIATVSNVKKTELDTIKRILKEAHLIDISNNQTNVLGLTTSSVLNHTTDIFLESDPSNFQKAALELSENITDLPKSEKELSEYISDTHKLSADDTKELFSQSEDIGFVDFEKIDNSKLYFNGNLFRKNDLAKTNAVLSSLDSDDNRKILELDGLLAKYGCISIEKAKKILGDTLLSKLQSIGMYDFNEVSNSRETKTLLTKPSAFSKYGNPFEEDAMDLAKAFVSSLYYGMNFRDQGTGQISFLKRLMQRLIDGHEVGPATAIGHDYKLLELKRVVSIRYEGSYLYYMSLLKKDIGELALQVLELGDAAEQTARTITSGNVTNYRGPEENRYISRKKQNEQSKKSVASLIRTFRS